MTSKHKDRDKDKERDRRRDRSRDRDSNRDRKRRSKDRDRSRDRDRDKDRESRRERRRSNSGSRSRGNSRRSRSRERGDNRRGRSKDREHREERDHRDDRDRERRRDKDRSEASRPREPEQSVQEQQSQILILQQLQQQQQQQQQLLLQQQQQQQHQPPPLLQHQIVEPKIDFAQTILDTLNNVSAVNSSRNFADLLNLNHFESASNDNSCSSEKDAANASGGESMEMAAAAERKRKKKSRWAGGDHDKTFIPGMPTVLPASMTQDQQEAYLVQLQIEEISRKLRTGELGISLNPEERSPSPEPIYSSDGKRLNTREFRTRKRLEEQRHLLITRMQCMNPEFKPPSDYKPPVIRVSDKVLIPQEENPDINFVGLLIGPRGNTLKAMEKETGAKIIIRGKGSVKEGKVGRKDGQPLPGEDEPLHAFITASNPEHVKKAVDKIKDVIRQGIEVPEGHNDLRRMQLRELAQLNGTLRETDGPRCTNCGSNEHKSWLCPDKPNITNNIVCSACGGAGHISKDCRSKRPGQGGPPAANNQAKIDEEYMSLMAELGEGPLPENGTSGSSSGPASQPNRSFSIFDSRPSAPPRPLMAAVAPPAGPPLPPQMPPWNQQSPINVMPPLPPPGPQQPMMQPAPWNQPPPPGMSPMPPPPGMEDLSPPPPLMQQSWNPPPQTMVPPMQQFPWGPTPPPPAPMTNFLPSPGILAAPPPPPPPS